jgi:hypothetical protein
MKGILRNVYAQQYLLLLDSPTLGYVMEDGGWRIEEGWWDNCAPESFEMGINRVQAIDVDDRKGTLICCCWRS